MLKTIEGGKSQNAGEVQAPPPHNIEAEQALLGALLINNLAYDAVSGFLAEEHFYDPLHGRIFRTCVELIIQARVASPVSLIAYFEAEPPVGQITVAQYLGRLASYATSVINAADYGKTIRDLFQLRELVLIGEDTAATARHVQADHGPEAQIGDAEARLFGLADTGKTRKSISLAGAMRLSTDRIALAYQNPGKLVGLSTGFLWLDKILGGISETDLVILAGRPSMGKTTLATNIAMNVAKAGGGVGFFSLEMAPEQISMRIQSTETRIPLERLKLGQLDEAEFRKLDQASHQFELTPFVFEDAGSALPSLILAARRLKRQHGIKLLVIDYLQLMASGRNAGNRNEDVTVLSNGLKGLARELKVPVLCLSQLSRKCEERANKRPMLSDLRDSGAIEQDADIVMFTYREAYYHARERLDADAGYDAEKKWADELLRLEKLAEVIIAKHRQGEVGAVEMGFAGHVSMFHEGDGRGVLNR